MSAYEIGAKVAIERTGEAGIISGAGQIDYGNSTGAVYVVDVGGVPNHPERVDLVYEEDLTFPDEDQDVVVMVRFAATMRAETAAIALARLEDQITQQIIGEAVKEMIERDRLEEFGVLKVEIVR